MWYIRGQRSLRACRAEPVHRFKWTSSYFSLRFHFSTHDSDQVGLLLLLGGGARVAKKDFLSVALVHQHVMLTWDVGGGGNPLEVVQPPHCLNHNHYNVWSFNNNYHNVWSFTHNTTLFETSTNDLNVVAVALSYQQHISSVKQRKLTGWSIKGNWQT